MPKIHKALHRQMVLPNFLIIGAARSGTTSLYTCLQEHPDIYLPKSKRPEPHFFLKLNEYSQGLQYYSEKYFGRHNGEKAIGEASTSYLYQNCAERIHKHLPDVRLIAILRNPVDRAYSNYWYTVHNKLENLPFEEAIQREQDRINAPKSDFWQAVQPHAYVDRGFYYKQLQEYLGYFKREKLLILIFEDFKKSPKNTIKAVFPFLGVNDQFIPSSLGLIQNQLPNPPPPMKLEIRKYLIELYKEENSKLSNLIDRDLSFWEQM